MYTHSYHHLAYHLWGWGRRLQGTAGSHWCQVEWQNVFAVQYTIVYLIQIKVPMFVSDLPIFNPRHSLHQRLHARTDVSRPLSCGRPSDLVDDAAHSAQCHHCRGNRYLYRLPGQLGHVSWPRCRPVQLEWWGAHCLCQLVHVCDGSGLTLRVGSSKCL